MTGLQRFETRAADGVKAVDFYLNGSKVMTRTRPPFEADLNLGPLPRKQTIRVVAFGTAGRAIGEDEYIVNEGREIFRVRIMSPEKGARVSGPTRVVAAVAVPEGKTLQKLEIYSNERRIATLYQAPFEQTVTISEGKSLGYVRIVGTLEDGTVAEDLRYVNAPSYISEVSVDAVELYTTVTDKGRPVPGLQASNFKVFEEASSRKSSVRVRQEPAADAGSPGRHVRLDARVAPRGAAGGAVLPRLLHRREGSRVHGVLRQRALSLDEADEPQGPAVPLPGGPAGRGVHRAL